MRGFTQNTSLHFSTQTLMRNGPATAFETFAKFATLSKPSRNLKQQKTFFQTKCQQHENLVMLLACYPKVLFFVLFWCSQGVGRGPSVTQGLFWFPVLRPGTHFVRPIKSLGKTKKQKKYDFQKMPAAPKNLVLLAFCLELLFFYRGLWQGAPR